MKRKMIQYLIRPATEIAIMLLVVSLFFGFLTTLLFKLFPSGISLTQILERREADGSLRGGKSAGGAVLDIKESLEQAAAVLTEKGNDVKSKGATSIAWTTAEEGMKLRDHDAIQTFSESSARINFDSKNYLTMGSNSLVIIKRIERELTHNERRSAIVVVEGELHARIASSGQNALQLNIATPTAVFKMLPGATADTKADFKISVKADSSTIVVTHGQAEVSANGKTVRVAENTGVTVKQGEAPKAATPLPPPPTQSSPADRSVIRYRELPPRVSLKWSAGKSGNRYHLQLARDPAFKELVIDRQLAETEFRHGNLKKGVYFWRVSTLQDGVEGPMSKGTRFEMVQHLAPPSLQVTFPAGPVLEERCMVAGSTEPGNRIFVGGKPVPTDQRGAFSCEVPIRAGMTLVTVEAVDASGNVSYRSHYVQGRF